MIRAFELNAALVQFAERADNWESAIRLSAAPLVEGGYVDEAYVDAMVASVRAYGPYICIAPQIAMPHARPEAGSNKVGFSVLHLREPVAFSEDPDHQSQVLITLSCVDAETHLEMLSAIVETLSDKRKREALLNAKNPFEITALFK